DRLEASQALEGRLPEAFVLGDGVGRAGGLAFLIDVGDVDRNDLGVEPTVGPRLRRTVLGLLAECVEVDPGDAPLLRDQLGALELRGVLVTFKVRLGNRLSDALA